MIEIDSIDRYESYDNYFIVNLVTVKQRKYKTIE